MQKMWVIKRSVKRLPFSNVELLSAILDLNETLAAAGLQVRVVNGLVSLGTVRIDNSFLSDYLAKEAPNQGGLSRETCPT